MSKVLRFLKSPAGNLVAFVVVATVGGFLIHRSNARENADAAQHTRVNENEVSPLRESILRDGKPLRIPGTASFQRLPRAQTQADESSGHENDESLSVRNRERLPQKSSARPRILPISLFGAAAAADGAPLSKTYAPFGRLIPCETVITVESSKLDTPVIGLVTEDVWHNGELIIPAGTEVHGRASLDRARERVAVSGKWVAVWRDGSPLNGTELVLNGIALDRAKDDVTGEFGRPDRHLGEDG